MPEQIEYSIKRRMCKWFLAICEVSRDGTADRGLRSEAIAPVKIIKFMIQTHKGLQNGDADALVPENSKIMPFPENYKAFLREVVWILPFFFRRPPARQRRRRGAGTLSFLLEKRSRFG